MEEAVTRFNGALEGLEAAISARRGNEDRLTEIESDLHLMALDRAQMARRLDEALAKTNDIHEERTQREALGARLDAAISEIDLMIEQAEAA
jgi:hypothetical protein